MQQTLLREQISQVSNNPLFELAPQIYLAFVATDRSQPSSDRTKRQVEVERIANGSDPAQIERGDAASIPLAGEVCREEPATTRSISGVEKISLDGFTRLRSYGLIQHQTNQQISSNSVMEWMG
jgi:hypothetical protein